MYETDHLARAAATLTRAMRTTDDARALPWLSPSLSAVPARMGPGPAAEPCAEAAATLLQPMSTTRQPRNPGRRKGEPPARSRNAPRGLAARAPGGVLLCVPGKAPGVAQAASGAAGCACGLPGPPDAAAGRPEFGNGHACE